MDALTLLLTRRSVPVPYLADPGPSQQQIDAALDAALRAPDHNQLRPWRFVLVRGPARQNLSRLFVESMQLREPPPPAGKIEKARSMPLTAPLIIAAGAHVRACAKVPEVEQLLAAGAGIMNLLNAFQAQGFGSIWLTGANAYAPDIVHALGFAAEERCLGFLYVGSISEGAPAAARRPAREEFVRDWTG